MTQDQLATHDQTLASVTGFMPLVVVQLATALEIATVRLEAAVARIVALESEVAAQKTERVPK